MDGVWGGLAEWGRAAGQGGLLYAVGDPVVGDTVGDAVPG
jgi:hypothetical protein